MSPSINTTPILVVPASELDRLGRFQGFCPDAGFYLEALLADGLGSFRPRNLMEEDPSFKQIIPYVIFRCAGQVFCYTRGKSQGEARLHARLSIGVGGHVDESDAEGRATYDAYEIALRRELDEEVMTNSPMTMRLVGLINDDSSAVGSVHLGVVHLIDLERPDLRAREEGLADARFFSLDELTTVKDRLETWSQIALENVLLA